MPELDAKKAELESHVGKEEAALDAMLESLKGDMVKIGADLVGLSKQFDQEFGQEFGKDFAKNSAKNFCHVIHCVLDPC